MKGFFHGSGGKSMSRLGTFLQIIGGLLCVAAACVVAVIPFLTADDRTPAAAGIITALGVVIAACFGGAKLQSIESRPNVGQPKPTAVVEQADTVEVHP